MSASGTALSGRRRTSAPSTQSHEQAARRHRIGEIQRARMLVAMIEVAAEVGADDATVAHVVERAGVSRRTFYQIFSGCEDCLLAAFEDSLDRVRKQAAAASDQIEGWSRRVRACLTALLRLMDQEPSVARLLFVESLRAGTQVLHRRQEAFAELATALDSDRAETDGRDGVSALTAEGVVGAVFSVIHARLLEEGSEPLTDLINPLMGTIVLPYLGPAAARRELQQPVVHTVKRLRAPENPLKHLEIRLTYRTVCALVAVAEQPRSSNRAIAEASGITDQGQVSKLLTRLEGLGLVNNTGGGVHRGEPNAWMLTRVGEEVHDAITARASTI